MRQVAVFWLTRRGEKVYDTPEVALAVGGYVADVRMSGRVRPEEFLSSEVPWVRSEDRYLRERFA